MSRWAARVTVLRDCPPPPDATPHGGQRGPTLGLIEACAASQTECFAAGVQFARAEGIVPAPEANHAVKGAIDEAVRCREDGVARTILFNLCGHGHFDMQAYTDYFAGRLTDQQYDESDLALALAGLPSVP